MLGEGEPGGLAVADEGDPVCRAVGVVAAAGGGAVGFGEQSPGFVEPQRLGGHAGGRGELADQHRPSSLQLGGRPERPTDYRRTHPGRCDQEQIAVTSTRAILYSLAVQLGACRF